MKYLVRVGEKEFVVEIIDQDGQSSVQLNGQHYPARLLDDSAPRYSFLLGNRVIELETQRKEDSYLVRWQGNKFHSEVETQIAAQIQRQTRALGAAGLTKELKSPLPGVIVKIEVAPGEEIQVGQGVLLVEAMKMENEIKCSYSGRVKAILVKEKQVVEKDQVLVTLE